MKILWIALKDLLQASRDGKGLLMLIAMPLVLIAILGAAFGSSFNPADTYKQFELGFVNLDGGIVAETLEQFLQSEELSELIRPVSLDPQQAQEYVASGKLAAAIIVPANASETFMVGDPIKLELLKDSGRFLSPMIAETIVNNFAESLAASQLVVKKALASGMVAPEELATLAEEVALELNSLKPIIREELSEKGAEMSAFQYYTAAMSVMFLLFAGMTGLQSILAEQRQQTFHRLHASPLNRGNFIFGKFFGILAIAFAQFAVLMLGTRYLFGVHWGNRPWEAAMVALAFAIAVSGLSLMVSSLIREEKTLLAVWPISVQICSALGGSMVPLAVFPPTMQILARFTPNYWGLQGFLGVMMGRPLDWFNLLPLLSVGLLALVIATVRTAAA